MRDLEGGLEVEKSANGEANRAIERLSKQLRSVFGFKNYVGLRNFSTIFWYYFVLVAVNGRLYGGAALIYMWF